jgi:hypothetical protein
MEVGQGPNVGCSAKGKKKLKMVTVELNRIQKLHLNPCASLEQPFIQNLRVGVCSNFCNIFGWFLFGPRGKKYKTARKVAF